MTFTRKPSRILIIEDDPISSNLLKNIFQNEGYEVREATDGITGLEMACKDPPDLICLDIVLPGLSGYEVSRSLKHDENCAKIPILIITSLTKREDVVKGLKSGASDYITKPFAPVEVLARVKVNLENRYAMEELLDRSGRFELACDQKAKAPSCSQVPGMHPRRREKEFNLVEAPFTMALFNAKGCLFPDGWPVLFSIQKLTILHARRS